jgi:hypothetical protein
LDAGWAHPDVTVQGKLSDAFAALAGLPLSEINLASNQGMVGPLVSAGNATGGICSLAKTTLKVKRLSEPVLSRLQLTLKIHERTPVVAARVLSVSEGLCAALNPKRSRRRAD